MANRKSCDRCKALKWLSGEAPVCLLDHPIDPKTCSPTEPCEKPLTYLAFIECRNDLQAEQAAGGKGAF